MAYRHIEALKVGGGYGSAALGLSPEGGATITNAGNLSIDGDLVVDGAVTAASFAPASLAVGGGYGSTGATIEATGNVKTNGTLTVDGDSTLTGAVGCTGALTADSLAVGGGYGSTGFSVTNAGVVTCNGALTADGTIKSGIDGSVSGNLQVRTNTANEYWERTGNIDAFRTSYTAGSNFISTGFRNAVQTNYTQTIRIGSLANTTGAMNYDFYLANGSANIITARILSTTGRLQLGAAGTVSGSLALLGSTSGTGVVSVDATAANVTVDTGLKVANASVSLKGLETGANSGTGGSLKMYGVTSGNGTISIDATSTVFTSDLQLKTTHANGVLASAGPVATGTSGTTRGILKAWCGASSNTPGYAILESPSGNDNIVFIADSGQIRQSSTSAPTANTSGCPSQPSITELHFDDVASPTALTLTTTSSWYRFDAFEAGYNTSVGNDSIGYIGATAYAAAYNTGSYLIEASAYIQNTAAAAREIYMGCGVNSSAPADKMLSGKMSFAASEYRLLIISGIVSLTANDQVCVKFKTETAGSPTINIHQVSLRMQRVA